MAQTNYTPISLYYSTTASAVPTAANLVPGELAINTNDGKLYYEDSSGVVQLLASKATSSGTFGAISATSITNSGLTSGRVVYTTTGGLETSSANLLYSGTDLTVYGLTVGRGVNALSTNTALGTTALAGANTGSGFNTAIGYASLFSNTSGNRNTSTGMNSLYFNTSGSSNTSVGFQTLQTNISGSFNTGIGQEALFSNTASNNTAVGYQAGYTNSTGAGNTFLGYQAGYTSTGGYNVCAGLSSGYALTTGTGNNFFGGNNAASAGGAGGAITTGSYNSILGSYNGNQGGLDIRTADSYIVLSDGSGNPLISTNSTRSVALNGAVPQTGTGITFPATQSASSNANTLDDYEEGTWTPVATSQLGSITAYTSSGTYTKIGRFVYLSGIITITTGGTATGVIFIAGYPFANGSSTVTQLGSANETDLTGQAYQVRINPSLTTGFIGSLTASGAVYTNGSSYSFSLAYST